MAHNIWRSIIVLVLLSNSTWAGCPPLTSQQVHEYQQKLDSVYSAEVFFEATNRLYHMRHVEWSNDKKELLLTIVYQYVRIRKSYSSPEHYIIWEGAPPKPRHFHELSGNLLEMIIPQRDVRFLPYLSERLHTGPLLISAVVGIGEPAFDTILSKLDKKYDNRIAQEGAVRIFEKWLERPNSFLQNGSKRQLVKRHLLQLTQRGENYSKRPAIDALRYINEPDVINHLIAISRDELLANNVRASARASLEFLKNR